MQETKRITKLFKDIYHGSPWIDVNLTDTLSKVTPAQAANRTIPQCNTIWEIVNHLIQWRQNVLQRVQGKVITTPSHNYFQKVNDTSAKAWKTTLKDLAESQKQWLGFLKKFDENDFEKVYPNNNMTYYEHIQGIIQHDAYHLGQIVMLSKLAKV